MRLVAGYDPDPAKRAAAAERFGMDTAYDEAGPVSPARTSTSCSC